ncbi:MAG: hypothetical protein COA58_14290 [Bacteroidetes bacterium]|nr:MAG: hypothetical protein COA58_14290 [Bacteroidota bacterium]
MKNIKTVIILCTILLFTFCNDRELVAPTSYISNVNMGELVKRHIVGAVFNDDNQPISGVEVALGSIIKTTNTQGRFEFFNAEVHENLAFIKARKNGYLLGSRSIVPMAGVNTISIKLLRATEVGTFSATSGGTVSFKDVTIDFKPGLILENGRTYKGKVIVKANYINPLADDFSSIMPGSLRAVDEDGETYLKSFGMVGVELTSENGEKLQLSEGNPATLSMLVPEEMLSIAPATIPLWHFDEENGLWSLGGEATLIGDKYVGEVNHFSFWNCDIRVPSVTAWGRVINSAGIPLSGVKVIISSELAGTRASFTSSNGEFGGIMPSGVPLKLKLIRLGTGKEMDVAIEPLGTGSEIGDLVFEKFQMVKVSGVLKNCDGSLYNGPVLVNDNTYVSVSKGNFVFASNAYRLVRIKPIYKNSSENSSEISVVCQNEDLDFEEINLCKPNQGKWIDGFDLVDNSQIHFFRNPADAIINSPDMIDISIFEDISTGEFRFRSQEESLPEGFFTIDIPSDHSGSGTYIVTDISENQVDFDFGPKYREIRNKNFKVKLDAFIMSKGQRGEVSVDGTCELRDLEGNWHPRILRMVFSFRL